MNPLDLPLGFLWPLLRPVLEPLLPDGVLASVEAGRLVVRAVSLGLPLVALGSLLLGAGGRLLPAVRGPGAFIAMALGLGCAAWGGAVYGASVLGAYPALPWGIGLILGLLAFGLAALFTRRRREL